LTVSSQSGVDAHGGHNNRKAGTYHFHQGPLKGKTFATKAEALATLRAGPQPSVHPVTPSIDTPGDDLPPWIVPSPRVRIWDMERGPYGQEAIFS
jgi:hypothetical protein